MSDGGPKWVIFCTIGVDLGSQSDRPYGMAWGIRIVSDEIEAVEAVATHVRLYDETHLPCIFMHPWIEVAIKKPENDIDEEAFGSVFLEDMVAAGYDLERNLYVAPK